MTKKWLMYAVTGILCCGIIGFAVAKQVAKPNLTARDRAKLELTKVDEQMLKYGATQELTARQTELKSQLGMVPVTVTGLSGEAQTPEAATQEMANPSKDRVLFALEQLNAGQEISYSDKLLLNEYLESLPEAEQSRNPLDDQGGPSAFGYRWVDNLGGDTATYAWEEPTAPVELTTIANTDDAAELTSFGINFPYYGGTYTQGWVSTNGSISLDASFTSYFNPCPRWTAGGLVIFPFSDDGHTTYGASSDGGRIVKQTYADHVTITWDSVGVCCSAGSNILDYQVQLWNTGKIKFQYRQIQSVIIDASTNGSSPLIGIQQSSTLDYLTYHCANVEDSAYTNALDGRAIWFYLGAGNAHDYRAISLVSPAPLQVAPNAVMNIVGRFTNFGSTTEAAPVKYSFNGGPVVSENTAALAQFTSEDHDWAGTVTAPAVVGDYPLVIYSDLATDADRTNDTLRVTVQVRVCADQTVTAPGSWTGTTAGAGDNCATRVGEDYMFEVNIPTAGNWTFSLCGGSTWDTYLYLMSSCCGTILTQNDDACGLQSEIACYSLTPGTYYVDIEPWSGASGPFTLNVSSCITGACCYGAGQCQEVTASACATLGGVYQGDNTLCANITCPNPCEMTCQPFDIIEVAEFDVCNHDTTDANGGCNNAGGNFLFQDIACGDTVCGRTFTYLNCLGSQYRDTDWFRFTLDQASDVSWTIVGEFPAALGFIIGGNCTAGITILGQAGPAANCGQVVTTTVTCLPAGEYYAWVGANVFTGLPFATNYQYRAWLTCAPPTGCPVGRCCYNDGASCVDNFPDDCTALGGVWDGTTTCAAGPCPTPVTNDDCVNAAEIIPVDNGNVAVASGAEGATPSCTDVCDYTSSGPDQFYYFTLDECRLIAIMADPNDPHISVYTDGQCCGAAILCNDDWGNNTDLDLYPWLPPTTRPTASFASMVADSLPAGTYYIRAGHYGSGWNGNYTLTLFDFGPCQIAPCDPIVDLAIYQETAANQATNIKLFWTAPQTDDYKVWSTTNPNNDGNPNDGADGDWTLEATLLGLAAGPQSWQALPGFVGYKNYVVTAVCEPFVAPTGRCCYGDFQCADITEAACNDLAGTWNQFQTCANNPCPPPPAGNDNCADAVEVFNGVPMAGDNITATNDWTATCTFDTYDVWYYYVAATTAPITVSLCDPVYVFDTTINVLETCGGVEIACNDDGCSPNSLQSIVTFTPAAPGTYLIRVAGFSTNVGTFTLTVTQ